jgi:hypothetical protein
MAVNAAETVCELEVRQTFQMLDGTLRVDGKPARIESLRLRGSDIQLVVSSIDSGREVRRTLAGVVSGDTIRGTARLTEGGAEATWQASRVARGKIEIDVAAASPRLVAHE